ncbi:MAG TPA: 2-hydroxyacyl-CoA dehydratase family protein [Steroidobacteraceae bacterium]|jgi:benzoyl-CoA reductase/2-hydroxyglutaryl-CoA dehydratase subunit BcrC/BadD/HgdB|nr:2-hydroxyacyl-CoA dehydratase family protein [Steroidobacteraceae bacterium]
MSTALELLRAHYRDRLMAAQAVRASGASCVVGLTGPTAPVELVLACGGFPVRISPTEGIATPTAEHYLDAQLARDVQILFECAMHGDFEFLDLLVLTRGEDKLFYFLKEMVRLGRAPAVPPMHMFDLMGSQRAAVREYNLQNLHWLMAAIERTSARTITDEALSESIHLTNRCRQLQRMLLAQRWAGRLCGVEAMEVIGAGFCMHPIRYAQTLERYLRELEAAPVLKAAPRLMLASSEPLMNLQLHQRVEEAGGRVVAEDDPWGSRAPGEDIASAGDPKQALLHKYWQDTAHAGVAPREARQAWFRLQIQRPDLDGVIFYVPPGDQQFGWDYPGLAAQVKAAGKASLLLRQDAALGAAVPALIREFIACR